MNVSSAPGRGTTFEIRLPALAEAMRPPVRLPGSQLAGRPEACSGTVLVVEDEQALRVPVTKMLRRKGFTVIEASDGVAACELFRANQKEVDVVLLDITLPGMSGRDVLIAMRQSCPGVNVILTTAYCQQEALADLGGQESLAFIRKPYRMNELLPLLQAACRKWEKVG
jgi:DNA-binding response OmpR family regulator